jgi:hypothetical protein
MTPEAELEAVVRELAESRVKGDVAAFASHMTPQALVSLHREEVSKRRPRRYQVLEVSAEGDTGRSLIEFAGGSRYAVVLGWQRANGSWKVTEAQIPEASIRHPWWRKLFGGWRRRPAERKDLS